MSENSSIFARKKRAEAKKYVLNWRNKRKNTQVFQEFVKYHRYVLSKQRHKEVPRDAQ